MRPILHDKQLTEKQTLFRNTLSNPKLANLLFSEVSVFEEQWRKDVTEFTKAEALEFLKSLNSLSIQSLQVYTWTLKKYAQFCGNEASAWSQISRADCEAQINNDQRKNKYLSESHIKALTAVLLNPVDRFILRGFYDGLCGEFYDDFMGLHIDSFDQENLTVKLANGNIKHISQDLYELAIESANTYTYIFNGIAGTTRMLHDVSVDKQDIVKYMNGSDPKPSLSTWKRKIRGRLEHSRNYLGLQFLSIPILRRSGIYNKLLKLSAEHECSVKQAVYLPEFKEIAVAYGLNESRYDSIAYRFSTEEYN